MGHCSFSATASPGITRSVQSAHVWTGRTVSAIRSKTTAHSLVKKSSLPDAAIRLLASASGTGVNGKGSLCYSIKDHRPLIGREELLARCDMPLSPNSSDRCCTSCLGHCSFSATASPGITWSVQAAQVWTGRAVSAIRPHGHHPLTWQEYILARCGLRSYHLNLRAFNDSEPTGQCLSEDGVSDMSLYSCGQGVLYQLLGPLFL